MADIDQIAQLLGKSLVPSERKEAEATLKQSESLPKFSLLLLQIVASDKYDGTLRLSSALYFKNFIKRNWTTSTGEYKLPQDEVVAIKTEIVGLMTTVPVNIQNQLGEAISSIADSDFYERWETLVDDLVNRLTADNADVNNGVLQVAHSIFKRWRPLYRSDELFTEINHVLSKFGQPFLVLLQHTDQAITAHANDKVALQKYFQQMNLIMKLFYDLSCQDLPPVFEENMQPVSQLLLKYVGYDNKLLHTDEDHESGVLEYTKAGIFQVLTLLLRKYDDAFGPYVQEHVTSCWNFLTNIGGETKYDILVSKALQFLTAVAFIPHHAQLFGNENIIKEVVQKVILPNITMREVDFEIFEDEPVEYIRRDLEGSDNDTRRRAATDFLRQIVEHHDKLVTDIVSLQINEHMQEYSKAGTDSWRYKDTAVYLFSSIAAKGALTAGQGVKNTNPYVDIFDFFQKHVAGDLSDPNAHPVLKVDAIKFLYIFRTILGQQYWLAAFPLLVQHLNSSEYVVYTYAAIAIERSLTLTTGEDKKQPIIPRDDVVKLSKDLLQHLFGVIQRDTDPAKIQENEFLMRCVMRVLIFIREGVLPITEMVLRNFINITNVIRHNPSNPKFYYYLFEGIGALIRFATPAKSELLEQELFTPFANIVQSDVQEFTPYVFQLFAALLEANPSGTLNQYYQGLIAPTLSPAAWESKGNVPALVRLLAALIPRGRDYMLANGQVEPILGIFQKLVGAKYSETNAFDLLETVISNFPAASLQQYFTPMLQIMLTRLSSSKTETFTARFVKFYHLFSMRDKEGLGPDVFVQVCDTVQHE
jgi:exportin-2 (importin alpha re-exporter)